MTQYPPLTSSSKVLAVTDVSAQFDLPLADGQHVVFVADVDCFLAQGDDPIASAADGSMFVPARVPIQISGQWGAKLAVVRHVADGTASLTRLMR